MKENPRVKYRKKKTTVRKNQQSKYGVKKKNLKWDFLEGKPQNVIPARFESDWDEDYTLKFLMGKIFVILSRLHRFIDGILDTISVLRENFILNKINTYHRWHHLLGEGRHLVQGWRQQIGDIVRTQYLQTVDFVNTVCWPLCCLVGGCCRPCTVGLIDLEGRVYLKQRSGVLSKTSSHMWDSWYLPMFMLRDGSLTLMNIAPWLS